MDLCNFLKQKEHSQTPSGKPYILFSKITIKYPTNSCTNKIFLLHLLSFPDLPPTHMKKYILSASLLLSTVLVFALFYACSPAQEHKNIKRGVYWWKGSVEHYDGGISPFLPWMKDNKIEKIYYKLYDVDWNQMQGIYPADGPYDGASGEVMKLYYESVPCVFITNAVFENATEPELNVLAERIVSKIDPAIQEYQVDCDWSAGTKEKYFYFLNTLKQKLPGKVLSVTVRLYQYKYPEKTGVPPADRGALMLYNFNSPKHYSEQNSIFSKEEAEKYITKEQYPVPLDFILPSFSWSVLYQHKEFMGLLRNVNRENAACYCTKLNDNLYRCNVDTVIEEFYIRKGNEIKLEDIDAQTLQEAGELVKQFKNTEDYTLSIFSLTSGTQNLVNHEVSAKVFGSAQ